MVFFLLCAQSFYFLTCKLFPKRNSLVGEIEWRVANTCWCVCSFKRPTSYFYIFCQNRQTDKSPFLYGCETIYTVWEFNIAHYCRILEWSRETSSSRVHAETLNIFPSGPMHAVEPSPNAANPASNTGSSKQQQRPPSKQPAMLAPAPDRKTAVKVSPSCIPIHIHLLWHFSCVVNCDIAKSREKEAEAATPARRRPLSTRAPERQTPRHWGGLLRIGRPRGRAGWGRRYV
jgi:hypothetical protein